MLAGLHELGAQEVEAIRRLDPIGQSSPVATVDAETKQQRPRPPFDATSWLQVAQKALGLTVKEASQATQAMFEGGVTTYPRTDAVRVSDEAIEWARSELERRFGAEFVPAKPWIHKNGSEAVQGAHEAIRPTVSSDPEALESRRWGQWGPAYTLVESRFLASQAAARVVEQTKITLKGGGCAFGARGQVETFAGWRRVLTTDAQEEDTERRLDKQKVEAGADAEEEDSPLPVIAVGEVLQVLGTAVVTQTTKPKPPFSQAALVAELRRLGIGRPSTYQSVVPLLLSRGWVTELASTSKGKKGRAAPPILVPTQVGFDLADFLTAAFPGLVDYEFTAFLEECLDEIEAGKRTRQDVGVAWWERFRQDLDLAKTLPVQRPERPDLGPCPKCSSDGRAGHLRLMKGISSKSGKPYEFAACDADTRESQICGHTAPARDGQLQKLAPCPECKNPMRPVVRKDGGHSWVCAKDGWFVASRKWELVPAPSCPVCAKPLVHREKTNTKGEFFWACFEHRAFADSNVFGAVRGTISVRSRDGQAGAR
jgi:DNA topoisomerase-1